MTTPPDTGLTVEKRAELRRLADDGYVVGSAVVLSLLDALDAKDREFANERAQSLEHKTARHLLASELVNLADGQPVTTQLGAAALARMTAHIEAALARPR